MTYQQYLMKQVDLIQLLLSYLPLCSTSDQRDAIMEEVRMIRRRVSDIEEMTKTEKQMQMPLIKVTIESHLQCLEKNLTIEKSLNDG